METESNQLVDYLGLILSSVTYCVSSGHLFLTLPTFSHLPCLLSCTNLLRVFHELDISKGTLKSLENKITLLGSLILVLKKEKHLIIVENKKDFR